MAERWCTVTVTDDYGRRHSLDVLATSTYDAAHLYVTHAKTQQQSRIPVPTIKNTFEVVSDGRIYRVPGEALQRWIASRRQAWQGPRGALFRTRPTLT